MIQEHKRDLRAKITHLKGMVSNRDDKITMLKHWLYNNRLRNQQRVVDRSSIFGIGLTIGFVFAVILINITGRI